MTGNTPAPKAPLTTEMSAEAPVDPDDAEMAAARAAVAAEQTTGDEEVVELEPEPAPAAAPAAAEPTPAPAAASAEPAPAPAPDATPPGMVPHAVFAKVNADKRALEEDNLYLAGQVEALRSVAPAAAPASPPPPAEPPKPTVAERKKAVREKQIALAAEYDAGKFQTTADYERAKIALEDELDELRAEQMAPAASPPPPPAAPAKPGTAWADKQLLQAQKEQLEASHPYLTHLNQEQLLELRNIAIRERRLQGLPPYEQGAAGTAELREAVAELSDSIGPRWVKDVVVKPAAAAAAPASPPAASASPPAISPAAAARSAKLALAAEHPPNTAAIGSGGPAPGDPTDAQVQAMSDDEIAALPPATRKRILER